MEEWTDFDKIAIGLLILKKYQQHQFTSCEPQHDVIEVYCDDGEAPGPEVTAFLDHIGWYKRGAEGCGRHHQWHSIL